ncbi:MAG: GNAT family N-acetyltransferase [Polyangiaceae bacterium]
MRAATRKDGDRLAETLTRAFLDDPLIAYFLPDLAMREVRLRRMFKLLFKWGEPYGACQVTPDFEAAILWRPPDAYRIPYWQYVTNGAELLGIFGSNAWVVAKGMNLIESAHPKAPSWYLQAVGTDPKQQGQGWGGAVIRRQLAIADAEGTPCYLESSKQANIPIYERLGFVLKGELTLPNGPTIWPMWRDARSTVKE